MSAPDGFEYETGFQASFWTRCTPGQDGPLADIRFTGSTLEGNTAPLGRGGAIAVAPAARFADSRRARLELTDTTVTGCGAGVAGGGVDGAHITCENSAGSRPLRAPPFHNAPPRRSLLL